MMNIDEIDNDIVRQLENNGLKKGDREQRIKLLLTHAYMAIRMYWAMSPEDRVLTSEWHKKFRRSFSLKKFLKEGELEALLQSLGAEQGDCVFIVSDKPRKALSVMGALRLLVAKELDIIPAGKWNYLWITEMPFFEQDEESGEWVAAHHPFTMPMEESIPYLDTDKAKVKAQAFDLVLNGTELSSGSMRITDCALQTKMFELLGMTGEEIDAKFGFLVDAYHYAAPPHGGMGIGLDRLAMLICGTDSLRDVVAFPKVQNASEPMSGAPSFIDEAQLEELSIAITASEAEEV